ncbi:cytochrome c biogenesis protein ResB [Geobacter sp.]|uniref:cytochrome c biogenesis protein ResB n=1 Tax=Geobacter sp. TaxID=46610 RepID=UPI00260D76BA|nr:cytochrome c biogenesis protein ResB [Geobacter sp.]
MKTASVAAHVVMKYITRFFLARNTILALILSALSAMLTASFVPQAFLLSPAGRAKWHADYPRLAPLAESLGLTHIYTHPLFALILLLSVLSLSFSCREQIRLALLRTFGDAAGVEGDGVVTALDVAGVSALLAGEGYRPVLRGAANRMVRHPWGYWGNVLFHAGVLVVIVSSLWIALTQQRGSVDLGEGETFGPGREWPTQELGLLARPFVLDRGVRLDRVEYEFLPSHGVKRVASELTFFDSAAPAASRGVAVNEPLDYEGLRIYQRLEFGHAFYITVTTPDGERSLVQLLLAHPDKPDAASYADYPDRLGKNKMLRVKYFTDAEKRSLNHENPLLVLRLDQSGTELGQLSLTPGKEGTIGGYGFRLEKTGRWSSLTFVKLSGIPGIFAGFFIICLGGALHYFTPPREAMVHPLPGGGARIFWKASRFPEFYREEFESLTARLTGENTDG